MRAETTPLPRSRRQPIFRCLGWRGATLYVTKFARAGFPDMPPVNPFYRCAGPNCGLIKNASDRWWLMWTSFEGGHNPPLLHLCAWDEEVAVRQGALPVCGEQCAQRLQSQFMGNILQNVTRKSGT